MERSALTFISYDPFKDERIDPSNVNYILTDKELPRCIHNAVARAKKLTGKMSVNELTMELIGIRKYIKKGSNCRKDDLKNSGGRGWVSSTDSDNLQAFFIHSDHDIDPTLWPKLLGIHALSRAGEIVNILWPSKKYADSLTPNELANNELLKGSYTLNGIFDLAIDAVTAVGFAEGVKALSNRNKNKRNATKTHQRKEPIFNGYIKWALDLPKDHSYRFQSHAEDAFLAILKQSSPEDRKHATENTKRKMREKLKTHCKENDIPYPF
jgi:hypothetical protein